MSKITFDKLDYPTRGSRIEFKDGKLQFPNDPIIPLIIGDGIGIDITVAAQRILDAAVKKAYQGKKKIVWFKIYAGDEALEKYGEVLPKDTIEAIRHFYVALKGPLTTPISGGFRSLNVTMRQVMDLYACVRPVRYFEGIPSPVTHPEKMNMIIFRENTEDVYAGIEWVKDSPQAKKVIDFLNQEMGCKIRPDSGIGIKPISLFASKRLVRKAIQYAVDRKKPSVTLVHKGNIMKYTEGAFKDWGYEVGWEEFGDKLISEEEQMEKYTGKFPKDKVVLKDRIADNMLQQILTRTDEYHVIATPNLNGDYISDACAAQVGGLGIAPGANIGDYIALFEATHGSAPKYAGKNIANPCSVTLSGCMMLEYLGWVEAAELVYQGISTCMIQKRVTNDFARIMKDVKALGTAEFADAVIENM